jgi:hypothetical protein
MTDRQLYDLFSEFTAMMVIHRRNLNDQEPNSLAEKFKRTLDGQDYLKDVFKVGGKLSQHNRDKITEQIRGNELTKEDLTDMKVPVLVCFEFCRGMKPMDQETKQKLLDECRIVPDLK